MSVRRLANDPDTWEIFVAVKNYGSRPRSIPLGIQFGGAPVATHTFALAPGSETNATFRFKTRAAGMLEARLLTSDVFNQDHRAILELPARKLLPVTIYSADPEPLKPVFTAIPGIEATFQPPSRYDPKRHDGIVLLDHFAPSAPPASDSIWLEPPPEGSPVPVRNTAENVRLRGWRADHPLAAGLRAQDIEFSTAEIFRPEPSDNVIADSDAGALVVARASNPKIVVLGFQPMRSALRYELTTPLLFANIVHWMAPDVFRSWELAAATVGTVEAELDAQTDPSAIRVVTENGKALPFTVQGKTVRFFTADPGIVRLFVGDRELVYSLTLPQPGDVAWKPSQGKQGLPGRTPAGIVCSGHLAMARHPGRNWSSPGLDLVRTNAKGRDVAARKTRRALEEGLMSFERAWVLVFLLLPLGWMLFEWRQTRRSVALAVKTLAFVAIVLALAEPRLTLPETRMAVAVLVDTSASIPPSDLTRASQVVAAIEKARGRHWTRILPFARGVRDLSAQEQQRGWRIQNTTGEAGRATDLESAIRGAVTSLPSGLLPRLVLISDGKENAGSVTRAAWQAERLGIPIDTILLPGPSGAGFAARSGESPDGRLQRRAVPVDLTVSSPDAVSGEVEIRAEGRLLGSNPVTLEKGSNQIRVHTSVAAAGAVTLSGVIRAGKLGEISFDRALILRRPRLLYISQDPEGSESHLMQTLGAGQFDVDRSADPMHGVLTDYQLAVLNNLDLEALPASRKDELEKFVKQGGGLLVIAGERNIYADSKTVEDALDRTLPAKLAPPRSPEGTAVVLIIDKSSSMEGKKIELARLAAIGVVNNLRPIDMVGVLIFDNSFQWAVPIRKADDAPMIKRLISGIVPDGGTQIAPALMEAYRRVLPARATFKHIVLLTDGISEEGDSLDLSKEAYAQHVTISTVGLGQDVNRAYLEKVASLAGGKSYFLNEPSGLEQIVLKDVSEHTGSTAVEKTLRPVVGKNVEILNGVGIDDAPALKGYVRFVAKPTSDTILKIDDNEPLLVRWQYGLGRAVVFTSDAKSRWAADWVAWKGFDKFWANVIRDLLPHAQTGDAEAAYDSASGDVTVNYQLSRDVDEPRNPPPIFIFGPNGFQHPVPITKVADKSYRGRIHVGDLQGLFRIRPLEESRAFPEAGLYRQEQELVDYGSNETLLRSISAFTGGQYNPAPKEIFNPAGRSQASVLQLWPGLLGLAILLNLAELIMRKGPGLVRRG